MSTIVRVRAITSTLLVVITTLLAMGVIATSLPIMSINQQQMTSQPIWNAFTSIVTRQHQQPSYGAESNGNGNLTCPDVSCNARGGQCTMNTVTDEAGTRSLQCDWPALTCNQTDIRTGVSNYGTCMAVFGINTTCTKPSIFVESLDECYLYGDHGYGGVLRCDLTRQFGRARNACVMRRLPGDPCNPQASQECYFGQRACVGFTCLGWLENGTCTTERDCIGGMECRCYRQGCATGEQVCRPRLRAGAQCTLPTGADDMVTRSCELGYLCNGRARHPYCAKMFSIPNGHLASDDQLCASQYRDPSGNCTAWPYPTLVNPGGRCQTDADCDSIPAGHGRCTCTTETSGNHGQCVLKQADAPDAKLAQTSWDLLHCASRANCHIEDQTLRAGMSSYLQTCLSEECSKQFDEFACRWLELEWDRPTPMCTIEADRRLWYQQLGQWHECIDAPYEDVDVRPLWSTELGLTLLISGSILVASFIVVLLRRWCLARANTQSRYSGVGGAAMSVNGNNKEKNRRLRDRDIDGNPHSHDDVADRDSPSTSRVDHEPSQSTSRVDGSFSAPLLTKPADDDDSGSGSDDDNSRRNGGSKMETFVSNGIRKSGSGRSLADEAARYDPPLLNLDQQHHQQRNVTFIAGVAGMNRSQSTLANALAANRQQQQAAASSSSSSRATTTTAASPPNTNNNANGNGSSRWPPPRHDDDDVPMVIGSAPI